MTFRSALLTGAACATLPAVLAAAQLPGPIPREKDPPSQQTRMQEKRLSLTVSGCVRGNRLKPSPEGSSTTEAESKPLGRKGRITLGVRESSGPTGNLRQPVRFRVTAIRHLHDACTAF